MLAGEDEAKVMPGLKAEAIWEQDGDLIIDPGVVTTHGDPLALLVVDDSLKKDAGGLKFCVHGSPRNKKISLLRIYRVRHQY